MLIRRHSARNKEPYRSDIQWNNAKNMWILSEMHAFQSFQILNPARVPTMVGNAACKLENRFK